MGICSGLQSVKDTRTAWAQEFDARRKAFSEVSMLRNENSELRKQVQDYEKVLIYCKHNKTGQGAKINGVLWEWGND